MEDLEQRYLKLKKQDSELRLDLARLEERLKHLLREKKILVDKIESMGINPENLESEIELREKNLNSIMEAHEKRILEISKVMKEISKVEGLGESKSSSTADSDLVALLGLR